MKKIIQTIHAVPRDHWALTLLFIVVFGGIGYTLWQENERSVLLSSKIDLLEKQLTLTTDVLEKSISETHSVLALELSKEQQKLSAVKGELGNFQQEVNVISGTIDTLEKLSETDSELLQKYSKVYFLSEHYTPERLAAIDKTYLYHEDRPESVNADAAPYLKDLLKAAGNASITLYVRSAYRSFDEQSSLKSTYVLTYGTGANKFSADQGYSEHQLGTTVDFITTGLGGKLDGFDNTAAYQWMLGSAHKYGFILSYPQGNTYYVFEPWYWRYVGINLATYLKNSGKNFYDLEQREIDEYLINIF